MITNNTLNVRLEKDGRKFNLLEYLYCIDKWGDHYRMVIGSPSDGMSGGKFVKLTFEDEHTFFCCVFHDGSYGDNIEKSTDGGKTWAKHTMTKDECDDLFYDNMIDGGESEESATIIYEGVHLFGESSFDEDRERLAI